MEPRFLLSQQCVRVELGHIIQVRTLQIEPLLRSVLDGRKEFHVEINYVLCHLDTECSRGTGEPMLLAFDRGLCVYLHGEDTLIKVEGVTM